MSKSAEAFRTISEVADELEIAKHVLRFWENRFPQIKPMKRGGGRRYYRPEDMELLRGIRHLLHNEGYTIRGVQKILKQQGVETVKRCGQSGVLPVLTDGGAATAGTRGNSKVIQVSPAGAGKRTVSKEQRRRPAVILAAAIKELEACRALLSGKKPAQRAKRRAKVGA